MAHTGEVVHEPMPAMNRPFRRLFGKMRAGYARFDASPVTFGGVLRLVLLWASVSFICVGPLMRTDAYSWSKPSDWYRGFLLVWPIALATLMIREIDRFRRARRVSKVQGRLAERRSLSIVRALGDLKELVTIADNGDYRHVRERILQCIALKVAEVLGDSESTKLTASLLDFSCVDSLESDNGQMRVVARSLGERETPVDYPRANLVAWLAIQEGKPRDVADCRKDDRFERLERQYRAVTAVPIVRGAKAIAAVSLDHPDAYRFWGRLREIEMALQPYIGILLLTYPPDVVGFDCTYDPSHSKVRS